MAKTTAIKETALYGPVKQFLVAQGYEVKGEVGAVDIVGCRDGDDPVVVELKTGFSLTLFHQAIQRQSMTDAVYIAVPQGSGKAYHRAFKSNKSLCRRLGLGLITVRLGDDPASALVTVHADPAPYKPRQMKPRKTRLLREFARRVGDPNEGGQTRKGLITSYRQDALKCLKYLSQAGATKASVVAKATGVEKARPIMADDHYGWFERADRGIYQMTPKGEAALDQFRDELAGLDVTLADKAAKA